MQIQSVGTCPPTFTPRNMAALSEQQLITLDEIKSAQTALAENPHVLRTPMLKDYQRLAPGVTEHLEEDVRVHLKMESMQVTGEEKGGRGVVLCLTLGLKGSFKIRGVMNMMKSLQESSKGNDRVVTMSAGNFGRSFAFAAEKAGLKATVVMPETAPADRVGESDRERGRDKRAERTHRDWCVFPRHHSLFRRDC